MRRGVLLLLLLTAPALFAEPFAVTNTRYGEAAAKNGVLTTNGRDTFVLWAGRTTINFTRIVNGEHRAGRPVLSGTDPGIVWTGQYFLAVADAGGKIVGRLLDATGELVGGVFTIVEKGLRPRIAWNGRNALLLYSGEGALRSMLLTPTGAPVNGEGVAVGDARAYDVASNGNGFAAITASRSEVRVTAFAANGAVASHSIISTFELDPGEGRTVAIASDGSGYLGVWSTRSLYDAVPVNADGTPGAPFSIGRLEDGEDVRSAAVAWNGDGYTAGFTGGTYVARRLLVARVSSHAIQSMSEPRPASPYATVSILASGGRTLMTWQPETDQALLLADASDPDHAVPVTFAAAHQELGTAVSSATGTLVAWSEVMGSTRSLYAGIRGTDGSWVERRIGGDDYAVHAGTNGTEFLLITFNANGWSAVRIDGQLNVLSRSTRIPLDGGGYYSDFTIAWSGSSYAVAYVTDDQKPALVRIDRNGVASPPLLFPAHDETYRAVVASDGKNFLFVWNDAAYSFFPPFSTWVRVLAVRLRPDLTPIDAQPLVLRDGEDALLFGTIWSGEQYHVFWTDEDGVVEAQLPVSGPAEWIFGMPATEQFAGAGLDLRMTPLNDHWLAIWPRYGGEKALYLDQATGMTRRIDPPFYERELIAMPGGGSAWLGTAVQLAPPHHGASRLMLDDPFSDAAVPDAPTATLAYDGREMRIDWTAPRQPAGGYRVEYRIGDGNWNELPRQYGATERSATWTSITRGKSYAFRVRAVGANGPGAYSQPVQASVGIGKRRAVR